MAAVGGGGGATGNRKKRAPSKPVKKTVKTRLIPPISGSSAGGGRGNRTMVPAAGLSPAARKYAFPGAPSNTSLKRFDAYNARQPGAPTHNVEKQSAREQAAWRRSVGIHKAY